LADKTRQNTVIMKGWHNVALIVVVIVLAVVVLCRNMQTSQSSVSGGQLRIVSLAPSVTEMLFILNLADSIVGVSNCCDYPTEAKKIESVGDFGSPNIEKLLALQPDMVITTGFDRDDDAKILRASGIEVLELKINSFHEMFEAMRKIGQITGKLRQAEEAVTAMQGELRAVRQKYSDVPNEQLPRVFVELWSDPMTTTGATSFIDEVIACAGGVNVAHDISQTYPCINPEKVIEWNPDIIIVCYMDGKGGIESQIKGRIGWAEISAVRNGQIIDDIQPDSFLRPGPRLIEGVKILAERIHGSG